MWYGEPRSATVSCEERTDVEPDGVDIALGDVSVSKLHAKISLTQNTFRVEDLESGNGVSIAGSRLASGGESRTAESDTHLLRRRGRLPRHPAPSGRHRRDQGPGEGLPGGPQAPVHGRPSAKAAIGAAERASRRGTGEQLIQSGAITVVQWTDAVRKARTWIEVQPTRSGPSAAVLVAVLIAIVAAAAGAYYFLMQSGS